VKADLVLFAVSSGFILARLGLLASFLTGPLLVAAFFAVTDRPVIRFPLFIYRLAQFGHRSDAELHDITAKSLQTITANWAPVVTLVITMLVLVCLMPLLRIDLLSAYLAATPRRTRLGGGHGYGSESGRNSDSGRSFASPNQRFSHRAVHGAVRGSAIKGAKRVRWNIRIMNRPNPIEYRRRLSVDSESTGECLTGRRIRCLRLC
jgi:hypothetical protein